MLSFLKNMLGKKSQFPQEQVSAQDITWGGVSWAEFNEGFSFGSAGVAVTPESSQRSPAVYACVQLIGGIIGSLPTNVYERSNNGAKESVEHDYWWLLNESPTPSMTSQSWWEYMVSSFLLRGDGISRIERKINGEITGLTPIPRECVVPKKTPSGLVYLVNDGTKRYGLPASDVLHIPNFGFNGVCGQSVISLAARQAIGTALQADAFSGEWFKNGANPSVMVTFPGKVSDEGLKKLRNQIEERHTGYGNRHRPLVLADGGTLQPVTISAKDSQLIETRQFQVVDIARAFGVAPQLIGEQGASVWGAGLEQISAGLCRYTLNQHMKRCTQEINRKFWPRNTKYYVDFDQDALVQGDLKTQSEYYSKALGGPGAQGWMTINEVRAKKNLPPVPGGEKIIFSGGAPAQPN